MRVLLPMTMAVVVLIAVGCRAADEAGVSAPPAADRAAEPADAASVDQLAAPVAYLCGDLLFTAQFAADRVLIQTPEALYTLLQVGGDAGAIYENAQARFTTRAGTASLRIGEERHDECHERTVAEAPPP